MKKVYLLFLLIPSLSIAQRWQAVLEEPNANFYDVQQAFYNDLEENTNLRQYGYKHFKRLEHYMEPRVYPTGEIKNFSLTAFEEHKNVRNSRNSSRSANWQSMGPKNWNNLGGGYNPGNGRVNSLVVHPTNSQVIYLATSGGGIWKTTNGGATWAPLTDDLPILETSDIILDNNNPSTVIFASGDNDSFRKSIGIYRSTDGGTTWTLVQPFTSGSNTKVGYIEMDPNNSNLVYCATSRGMYRSLNNGSTWSKLNSTPLFNIKLKPNDPAVVYATNGSIVRKSVDSGQTFQTLTSFPTSSSSRIEISTSTLQPDYLYALAANSSRRFGGIYLSKDGGVSWSTMSTSPNILGYATDGSDNSGQGTYDLALEVNPTNPAEVVIGGINAWKSIDTGKTWINLSYWYLPSISTNEYTHADIHYMKYYGSTLYCGSDGGIYTSNDLGYTWSNLSLPLEITEIYDFDMYQANNAIVTLGTQDNGTFKHNGGWTNVNGADGFKSLINQTNPDNFLFSSQYGSFEQTFNGGSSQSGIFSESYSGEDGAWETPIVGSDNLDTILIGHDNVWVSLDHGTSFNPVTTTLATSSLRNMKRSKSNPSVVYAGDYNELFRIVINYAAGTSTQADIKTGLPISSASISDILIHPYNDSIVWVTFSGTSNGNKVYKTTDAGATWTNISGALPNASTNCIEFSELNEGLYVGMDAGIYYMDTSNTSWTSYFTGMPNAVVTKIIVTKSTGEVKASTFGRGMWESDGFYGQTVGVKEIVSETEVNIYPNPTNNIIFIDYNEQVPVEINITDMLGKLVYQENEYTKGNAISIAQLKQGVYNVNVKFANNKFQTRRIIKK